MKKIKFTLIFIMVVFCSLFLNANIFASVTYDNVTIISEDKETLEDGIIFNHQVIKSNYENNSPRNNDVYTYTIPTSSKKAKLATWTYSYPYGYSMQNLMQIAKDYEDKHPGWIVVGGINTEGYVASSPGAPNPYELTNAFVQDGDVIRKDISDEETKEMLALYDDRSYIAKRLPSISAYPYLYVYDEGFNSIALKHLEVKFINSLPTDNEIAILTPALNSEIDLSGYSVIKASSELYRVTTSFPGGALSGNNYGIFEKGQVLKEEVLESISSVTVGTFYIVTKDSEVLNSLQPNTYIKCQYDYLDEFGSVSSAVGYWFKYIDNGVICDKNYQTYLEEEKRYSSRYGEHAYWYSLTKERAGIGFKENGDVVILAAHYQKVGPTQYEVGQYFSMMGCNNAYQFDGGGSVTFIKRNELGDFDMLNTPGDGSVRSILSGLFIVVPKPIINLKFSDIKKDSISLNFDILNENGYSVEDVYIYIKNTSMFYLIDKNGLTLQNLTKNTTYTYELFFEENDQRITTNITGSFKTASSTPEYYGCKAEIDQKDLSYQLYFRDSDATIKKVYISLDGINYTRMSNYKSIISDFNYDCLNKIYIKYTYDINDNNGEVEKLEVVEIDLTIILLLESLKYQTNDNFSYLLSK